MRMQPLPQNSTSQAAFVDPVLEEIFCGERDSLDSTLESIVVKNQSLGGTMNAFTTSEGISSIVPQNTLRGVRILPLHEELKPSFNRYKTRVTQLKLDVKKIRHALSMVLSKCTHEQDIRDVLPDVIASKIPQLKGIPRDREEGFILRDRPAMQKQYTDAMEIALHYQANRLIE